LKKKKGRKRTAPTAGRRIREGTGGAIRGLGGGRTPPSLTIKKNVKEGRGGPDCYREKKGEDHISVALAEKWKNAGKGKKRMVFFLLRREEGGTFLPPFMKKKT